MANKIYVVDLTEEERTFLLDFINRGTQSARKLKRAHILLLASKEPRSKLRGFGPTPTA